LGAVEAGPLFARLFMFAMTRRSDTKVAAAPVVSVVAASLLGPGVLVQGALEIEGELTVLGVVTGRIAALKLIIGVDGRFEGDIVAREVIIAGQMNGRVFAPIVTVEASADIHGRIFHNTITVSRGARIDGRMPWRPVSFFETLKQLPETQP